MRNKDVVWEREKKESMLFQPKMHKLLKGRIERGADFISESLSVLLEAQLIRRSFK